MTWYCLVVMTVHIDPFHAFINFHSQQVLKSSPPTAYFTSLSDALLVRVMPSPSVLLDDAPWCTCRNPADGEFWVYGCGGVRGETKLPENCRAQMNHKRRDSDLHLHVPQWHGKTPGAPPLANVEPTSIISPSSINHSTSFPRTKKDREQPLLTNSRWGQESDLMANHTLLLM